MFVNANTNTRAILQFPFDIWNSEIFYVTSQSGDVSYNKQEETVYRRTQYATISIAQSPVKKRKKEKKNKKGRTKKKRKKFP